MCAGATERETDIASIFPVLQLCINRFSRFACVGGGVQNVNHARSEEITIHVKLVIYERKSINRTQIHTHMDFSKGDTLYVCMYVCS